MIDLLRKYKEQFKKILLSILALFSQRFGFKRQELEYFNTYSDENIINDIGACLIVMFDGRQIHCGVTDRFKGICTAYEFSKDFNLPFYINYCSPFELEDYFLPNKYEWRINKSKILYSKSSSVPVFINDWQSLTCFHKLYLKKVINANPGKQIHLYINSPFYIKKYTVNFNYLFRPSFLLEKEIDKHIKCLNKNYVAMAFRFLQLLGDFKEEHSLFITLSEQEQIKLINKCENKVISLIQENNISGPILFTSDSSKFLEYMKNKYDFVYVIPGAIAHIDNAHTKDQSLYIKTFVDILMLSRSKKIYQICTDGMYRNSAFARQAAALGNVEYSQICF